MRFSEIMNFDENLTVEELENEINREIIRNGKIISPILFKRVIFNGRLLFDRNQTMRELGITESSELTLMSTQAEDPDIQ